MRHIRTVHLKILQGRLNDIAGELTQFRPESVRPPHPWRPNVNVYRCADRFLICVELAGVDRREIDLRVDARRVSLGGRRACKPAEAHGPVRQVLALEINEGRWERHIPLTHDIAPDAVRAEQRNGLLWIDLPFRSVE